MMPSTICSISRCSSGSPPAITTIGAPHSSTDFEAFGDAEPLVQDRVGIVDLAAAGAGQVAAEQRLQHQHERVAPDAAQMPPHDIGADTDLLVQWDGHGVSLLIGGSGAGAGRRSAASACGSERSR